MNTPLETVYVPVTGATLDFDEFVAVGADDSPFATFRKLHWPGGLLAPGRIEKFYRDAETLTNAQLISRSTFEIEYRVFSGTFADHSAFVTVYLQLLMIKAGCRLAASCYATHSLALIDAMKPKLIEIKVFDREATYFNRPSMAIVPLDAIKWASANIVNFLHHNADNDRLMLAFHSLGVERFAHSPPMALLTLWSGLEALFAIEHEQTFRLSMMAAYYLEDTSDARKNLFEEMRSAYAMRSAVTHGRKQKPRDVANGTAWIASILRRCVVRAIETKSLPTTNSLFFP